jgi:protoporphyrin/coproporphyrin ferrochelatase
LVSDDVRGSLTALMTVPEPGVTELPAPTPPVGVLLLQLGTPDSTAVEDVRIYLREFLGDPRVLDMPAPARALLLNAVILPFRPKRSAEQYEKIWTEQGSPLTIHTQDLTDRLQERLGDRFVVAYGMRYRNPPIATAVDRLAEAGCTRVVVVPLFPHYASASSGSALERALEEIAGRWNVIDVTMVGAFFDDPGYVGAVAEVARPPLAAFGPDHVLFSYHGLPEHQLRKSHLDGASCADTPGGCHRFVATNRFCYRAQCLATTRGVAAALGLAGDAHGSAFQSRLKGQKWIEPFTDVEVERLYASGVRRLAVLTPSFVADCLETLEEIGIRLREQWAGLGGEDLLLVPCINAEPQWVEALAALVSPAR